MIPIRIYITSLLQGVIFFAQFTFFIKEDAYVSKGEKECGIY